MLPLDRDRFPNVEHEAESAFPLFDFHDLGKDSDGKKIDFPDIEYYGLDHGKWVAHHATVILTREYPELNKPDRLRALWSAGLFHDIGRSFSWKKADPLCAKRSAELADIILRKHNELDIREEVCRLIYRRAEYPGESTPPPLRCLWDANAYDAARFAPGTREGLARLKDATAPEKLCTEWARNRDNLRKYMAGRGWT